MSPRNAEQNEEVRQRRREQILEAALAVYVEKGYAATEVGDIANEAGVARGLIFYYFKTKKGLFQALFIRMREQSHKFAKELLLESKETSIERLSHYARQMLHGALQISPETKFYMRAHLDAKQVFGEEYRQYQQSGQTIRDYLITVVKQGMEDGELRLGDPEVAASSFWGALTENFCRWNQLKRESTDENMLIEEIAKCCLYGIATPISGTLVRRECFS